MTSPKEPATICKWLEVEQRSIPATGTIRHYACGILRQVKVRKPAEYTKLSKKLNGGALHDNCPYAAGNNWDDCPAYNATTPRQ